MFFFFPSPFSSFPFRSFFFHPPSCASNALSLVKPLALAGVRDMESYVIVLTRMGGWCRGS